MFNNFEKETPNTAMQFQDLPYDYKSLMHYSEKAFSKNGKKTIEAKDGTSPLGNEVGMTDQDVKEVNALYRCSLCR